MDTSINQNKKALLIAFISVIVITMLYFAVTTLFKGVPLSDLENRGIETPIKLWLNGYFGLFFGFKSNGNIIWLLPLLLIFAWNKVKQYATLKYFMAFYILLFMLIALKGYINGRYQFTLVPVSIISIIFLIKEIFDEVKLQQKLFYLLLGLTLFNTLYFTSIDYWPRYKERFFGIINGENNSNSTNTNSLDYLAFINNEIPENELVLVNNLPEYFYYTNRKGLFCWTGQNVVFTPDGEKQLIKNNSDEELKSFIVNELNCNYFFTTIQLNNYQPEFTAFLNRQADLVFTDQSKYLIYRFKP